MTLSCGASLTKALSVGGEDIEFIFKRLEELKRLEMPLKQAQQLAVTDAIIRLEKERQEVLAAVREKLAGMESKPDAKASFWREGVNNETQRPVYNFNPDSGAFWASVQNPSNGVYAIEYKKGQAVVETEEITGSLTQVKFHAQERVAKIGGVATHQDPGQKPEAATAPVIAQSLAKAGKNEQQTQKEMRLWLLSEIDAAVKLTEDYADYQKSVKDNGQDIADSIFFGKHSRNLGLNTQAGNGMITFDVPGDGKFKVRNSLRGLMEFRAKVEGKSGTGFTDKPTKPKGLPASTGVAKGSSNQIEALSSMLEELDFEAAVDYARETGVNLDDAKISPKVREQFKTYLKDGTEPKQFSPSRYWEYPGIDGADKDGNPIRRATLTKQIGADEYQANVTGTNATGFKYNITKSGKSVHAMLTSNSFANALKLAEDAINAIQPEVVKPKDTGWNMAGVGYAGKRYRGRNITLDDGREVVARIYENAGQYEDAEVKVDGVSKFRKTDRYKAEKLADDFIRTLTAKEAAPENDLMGFTKKATRDDGFTLTDGNMLVTVESTSYGFQASHGSSGKSGPRLTEQQAVEWAAALRDESKRIQKQEAKPEPVKEFRNPDTLNVLHNPIEDKDWFKLKNGEEWQARQGYSGRGWSLVRNGNLHPEARNFESQSDFIRSVIEVTGQTQAAGQVVAPDTQANDEPIPAVTEAQARKQFEWRNMGQKDGTKSHRLFFFEREADKGTGRAMGKGEVSLYPGASGWKVEDGDGTPYPALADAKAAAIDAAILNLQDNGYVLKPAQDSAQPANILDAETSLWSRITDGTATLDEFKAGFERWVASKDAIIEALSKSKKDDLLKMGGSMFAYRNKSETKPEIVEALWRDGANQYVLARSFSHGMGKNAWLDGVRNMVENTDADQLAQYAQQVKTNTEEAIARVGKIAEAIKDPKTLDDYITWMRATMREGKTFKEARMMLTLEQRSQFDELAATESRSKRKASKDEQRTSVSVAGQTVDGNIIATKHTKNKTDLFVVRLVARVSKEDYDTLNAGAKRIGGYYSSFRGAGAVPGFTFTDRPQAEAFVKLAQGDNTDAKAAAQANRDAFEDDRSQTAVQRLTEMADRLEEQADASLNQERKTNTSKRAGQAASAEASANTDKAMAKTMRNIATAIGDGTAKFLDRVRQKVQVSMLQGYVTTAKGDELRAKYESYSEQERHKGEAPTAETADFSEFPTFTAYRSDLATLARQLLEVDGTKILGQRLLKEADDVSDAYTAFAKENFGKVSAFSSRGGGVAAFGTKADAEAAIARSGYKGKAIAYQVKRGQHAVILSPSEAIERGIWQGDGDKRLTLTPEIGAELVEKIGKAARRGAKVSVPWQLETAHDRRKALARMGIETPAEFRAALREFIGLQEQAQAPSKIKELERAMIGRKNDGMDFFPTPESVADEMVTTAGIEPGMSVLEPSAGWGHIAERIRAAGVDPDVGEMSNDRRELLEAKGFNVVSRDFMELNPREFYMFGDTFKSADGTEGVMRGSGGLGSNRVRLVDTNGNASFHDRDALTGIKKNGTESGYDRILMNPPFSDGRDIQHVQHAYTLLKPGGRIVAIMGESAFTNQNKRATEFREWLESVGGTEEKLAEGSFNDPTLPVNTGANARMVVIDRAESSPNDGAVFSTRTSPPEKQLALQQIERLVQSALRGVKNAPTVRVVANPEAIGLRSPVETIPSGVVLANGDIYVFQSGVGSALDVDMVVFHELFHKGLQNVMPRSDYVAAMQDIAKIDAKVRQYASEWSDSNAGKDQLKELAKKYSGKELADQYEALATEEGLARIAEDLKAKREMGSKDMRVRRLVSWLAKMADKIGMTRLAESLRAMSYSEAEKFVIATIGRAGAQVSQNATTAPDSGGARFRAADTLNAAANNVRNVKLPAGYLVGDLINGAPGKLNWWHRSVGTMYNLAQRSKPFKRVFDSVQTFINDVSYYATEAADLAPNILPKLETWKDIAKSPLSAADTKAISAPIFEGTLTWARDESGKPVKVATLEAQAKTLQADQKAQRLLRGGHVSENVLKMWQGLPVDQFETIINGKYERDVLKAGIVFTDAELKSIFNLTDKQIPLYREFRKATDKSLTNLAIADMLRFGGEDVAPIREAVLDSKDVTEAAETLRDYLLSIAEGERNDVLTDTANKMIEKGDKAADLIKRGYAPLSRFGQYTLDVVHNGERVYFSMFESKWEAARMNRQMQAEYPGAQITQGTVSEQAYKMFAGVSPETLELFGDMLGLEAQGDDASAKAFQEYLKLAKSSRSAMKRLIHRKGIAGFNEDAGRVLAGFVYSNARQTASSLHMGEMTNAANDISQTQGELKDAAVKLVDYIKNPQEEAQKLRGLLFAQYIGGSVASAMVNITQPLTMTFPWLSQYGTISGAAKQMTAATKDALKRRTGDAKLDAALHRAEEDGTVSPQEVHQLMQQAQGKGALQSGDGTTAGNAMATAQNSLSRFSLAWGKLFSTAEQFNRRVTFIAAYRTAIEKGMADPDIFARKAIAETQGVYNKGNKPAWARGAIGSTLFTFKQYSIAYMEMLSRMAKSGPQGKKAALLALGVLFLMSGAGGVPGADDLDDLISGALQALGYNFDSKARRKEFFVSLFGEGGAQFVERGVSGLPGVPIDVSGRMGLGNLIPGTGLFTKKTDHTRDVAELAGPAGDLANRTFEAAGKLIKGDAVGSAVSVSPKAFQNLHQAYDMANMGMYRDASGKKVIDTDGYDAIAKAIGFQPTDVKRIQDASIEVQRMIGLNKMRESEIADKWALGMFEKNPAKVEDARNDLKTWNADNPSSPIRINFGQIIKRVQKMNETKTQRIAKTAPREIRETVRRELATQ